MSIEITGPERYEFQYYVTLEIVLRFWHHKVRAVVDSGGEDSTLNVELDGATVELELQVKGAEHHAKAVDAAVLREYLAHFPSRLSTGSLLERLLKQPSKLVVFVCAQRAMDFASPLTVRPNWCGKPHRNRPLSTAAAQSFLTQIVASKPAKDTPLERSRANAFSLLGKATAATELNDAFRRLIIQDNVTKEDVVARMLEHLRRLGVPNDRADRALLQMLQRVRDSKGSGTDVVPGLRDVLNAEVTPPVKPGDYVARGIEEEWIEELTAQRALLLSGPPRSGKTDSAKWIAGALQETGFNVFRVGLVDEAERILLDRSGTEVLVVLDDPLGSDFEANSKAGQALRSLERLIRELQPNRRLVVAQSQEVLLASRVTDSLDKVKTGGLRWHDLGRYPPGFLSKVWDVQAEHNNVSDEVKTAVASAIASGQIDVPPGVLTHVAGYHQQLRSGDVIRQVQSLASESAIDFAATLRSSGAQEVIRALAIGSTANETSADRELAFILGAGPELESPAAHGVIGFSSSRQLREPAAAPSYTEEPTLLKDASDALANLERHRVLRRKEANHFEFAHPFYRAAGRAIVRQAVSIESDVLLSAIRRGLFAPAPSTSAATARNLWWLHRDLDEALGLGKSLVDLAESGLHWHFPTTRDLCYEFLLEVVKAQPERYLERLQHWVHSMSRTELEDVVWDSGVPFFPTGSEYSTLSFLRTVPAPDEARVHQTAAKLHGGDALPNTALVVELLRFYRARPSQLKPDVLLRLLSFPEGLIRAEAAYVWLLVERVNDAEILERLRRDTHPSVVSRMVDAVIKVWNAAGVDRRAALVTLLRASSGEPETAAILVSRMLSYFYDDDDMAWSGDRASEPWALVGEVLAPALKDFPNSFRMAGMRLYDVCNTALAYLTSSSSEAVVTAWIDWLQIRIGAGHLPDDYMLGLVTSLLDAPALSADDRRTAIARLLEVPSTGAALVFVANLVARWDDLREYERSMVLEFLSSGRDDDVWMRAAALTQDSVPAEVQSLVLGASDAFDMPAHQLIDSLPPDLLTACVRMHRGVPQPLWYLGHHHDNSSTWKNVIRQLARMPAHPLFEDCLNELFGFERRYGTEELSEVIRGLGVSDRQRAFTLILGWKTEVVGDWHQREFDLLLELAPDDITRAGMVSRMVEESIHIIEDVDDVDRWSQRADVREALKEAFTNDFGVYELWRKATNVYVQATVEIRTDVSELLTAAVERFPPKLISTHWDVNRYLKALDVDGNFLERAATVRERVIADFKERRRWTDTSVVAPLPDWIGPG